MALLPIIHAPDPRLKVKSAPVSAVDDNLRRLMDDMLETMYAAPGIGLAAVQIGVPKQVIVIDISREDEKKSPLYLVNPRIVAAADEDMGYEEGCLSLPGQYAEVLRPAWVEVTHLTYEGKPARLRAEGLLATCVQHEMDHLDGILFVDHISTLKRNMILRRLLKERRQKSVGD